MVTLKISDYVINHQDWDSSSKHRDITILLTSDTENSRWEANPGYMDRVPCSSTSCKSSQPGVVSVGFSIVFPENRGPGTVLVIVETS